MDRLRSPSRSRSRSLSAEAERRVRSFLRGLGVEDGHALKELARRLARSGAGAHRDSLEAAAGRWFAYVFGWPEASAAKALAAGRVAWLAADAGKRWPHALFTDTPPMALTEVLRRSLPALPPAILDTAMPAAELAHARVRQIFTRPARLRARPA